MRPWWPLVAVCLGTFMLLVDVTIVNVALPPIAASLGTSFGGLQWVIDGYAPRPGRTAHGHGHARRPVRPAPLLPRRARGLRGRVAGLRPGPDRGRARRGPHRAGRRRGGDVRDHGRPHRDHVPRPEPRHRLRRLGGGQRARRRGRPAARRAAHADVGLAGDLPGQPAGRGDRGGADPRRRVRVGPGRRGTYGRPRGRHVHRRLGGAGLRTGGRGGAGLGRAGHRRRAGARGRRARGVPRRRAPQRRADARPRALRRTRRSPRSWPPPSPCRRARSRTSR